MTREEATAILKSIIPNPCRGNGSVPQNALRRAVGLPDIEGGARRKDYEDACFEICESFRISQNKRQQVQILVELTDTDVETVVEILRDAGLYVKERRCLKCGKVFKAYVSPRCDACEYKAERIDTRRRSRRKWIEYEIERNKQRKASLLRQAALVELEIERLKEAME